MSRRLMPRVRATTRMLFVDFPKISSSEKLKVANQVTNSCKSRSPLFVMSASQNALETNKCDSSPVLVTEHKSQRTFSKSDCLSRHKSGRLGGSQSACCRKHADACFTKSSGSCKVCASRWSVYSFARDLGCAASVSSAVVGRLGGACRLEGVPVVLFLEALRPSSLISDAGEMLEFALPRRETLEFALPRLEEPASRAFVGLLRPRMVRDELRDALVRCFVSSPSA
mmetsp:Transcript_16270/g.38438  ORF Transcript_16270/g.38438 Transcript_16270/m.38438 type:complete len:227 (-) Transcript_16270:678-1358(-)